MDTLTMNRLQAGVAEIVFERPRTLHSMTRMFVSELDQVLRELASDPKQTRAIVLRGSGDAFSSGHDLSGIELGTLDNWSVDEWLDEQEAFANLMLQIHRMPQAVIAAVSGPAVGGGLAMALAADIRLCTTNARFGVGTVRIGLSGCDVGMSYFLPRAVGTTLAFEMMLSGRLVGADEALRAGLVFRICDDATFTASINDVASSIASNSPFAIRLTTKVMRANLTSPSLPAALALEDHTQVLAVHGAEHREALRALMERRSPVWSETSADE